MKGFVKLNRAIAESPIWLEEPFSRGQAWVDLILSASYQDSFFYVRGNKVSLGRGQTGMSQLSMAKRWKWSRGKVRRFLNDLSSERMIVQQPGQLTSILTICNYSKYQDVRTADDTTDNTADGQQTGQQTVHIQEVKELKEDGGGFQKPSLTELRDFIVSKGYSLPQARREAEKIILYYDATNWTTKAKSGKQQPMVSWKLSVVNWLQKVTPEKTTKTIAEIRAEQEAM